MLAGDLGPDVRIRFHTPGATVTRLGIDDSVGGADFRTTRGIGRPKSLSSETMPSITQSEIDRYARGPSPARAAQVKSLQESIRQALEESDFNYETFLQGSYRNSTAIADINDVDIVALRKFSHSPQPSSQWEWQFREVARVLRDSWRVTGSVSIGDKCVKIAGAVDADIVPALAIGSQTLSYENDPIAVYSRRVRMERENYPRVHYRNGVRKQSLTNNAFKPTVRLFKRWARQYHALNAPSFYLECAVHKVEAAAFKTYLPLSFLSVGVKLLGFTRSTYIPSVAGDKDILVSSEWAPSDFESFQRYLSNDLDWVIKALEAPTATEANRHWRRAFGD